MQSESSGVKLTRFQIEGWFGTDRNVICWYFASIRLCLDLSFIISIVLKAKYAGSWYVSSHRTHYLEISDVDNAGLNSLIEALTSLFSSKRYLNTTPWLSLLYTIIFLYFRSHWIRCGSPCQSLWLHSHLLWSLPTRWSGEVFRTGTSLHTSGNNHTK